MVGLLLRRAACRGHACPWDGASTTFSTSGRVRSIVPFHTMVQPVEKGLLRSHWCTQPWIRAAGLPPPRSRRSSPEDGRGPLLLPREGDQAPTGGLPPAPSPRGQEAFEVLSGRDQQSLDVGIHQAPQAEAT